MVATFYFSLILFVWFRLMRPLFINQSGTKGHSDSTILLRQNHATWEYAEQAESRDADSGPAPNCWGRLFTKSWIRATQFCLRQYLQHSTYYNLESRHFTFILFYNIYYILENRHLESVAVFSHQLLTRTTFNKKLHNTEGDKLQNHSIALCSKFTS